MQTLLVSSFTMDFVTRVDHSPPLALLTLAAILRQEGCGVSILDLDVLELPEAQEREDFFVRAILQEIKRQSPGMLGFNCLLSGHFPFIRRAAQAVKKTHPELPIVIGGIHPTLFAQNILQNCPEIDVVVMGEGEYQAVELAKAFEKGRDLASIGGIAYRDHSGQVRQNQRRGYIKDLDSLPNPAWDMIRMDDYSTDHSSWYNPRGLDIKMSVPIITSRSCPFDCSFCSAHHLMGRGLRLRSPVRVADEMQMLYDRHGMNYFGFVDDNLTLNKQHIMELCNEIVRRGMKIQFESFNGYNLASLDEEIVDALVQAGCVYVIMPIEHGNDWMRNKIIGKNLPREQIFKVAELYKKHNLLIRGVFIMGFPEDTPETLQDTLDMINFLPLDMSNVFNLIPFPGTRIFDQARRDGLFLSEIDPARLWEGLLDLNAVKDSFYLQPYAMELGQMMEFRKKFDDLRFISDRIKKMQLNEATDA